MHENIMTIFFNIHCSVEFAFNQCFGTCAKRNAGLRERDGKTVRHWIFEQACVKILRFKLK